MIKIRPQGKILGKLQSHTLTDQVLISSIHSSFPQEFVTYRLQLLNHRLVLISPVDTLQKCFVGLSSRFLFKEIYSPCFMYYLPPITWANIRLSTV